MKKSLILAGLVLAASSLFASEMNLQGCKGCHGQNFEKKALGQSKIVSEMSKEDLVSSLKGYKDGTYGRTMKGLMKGQVTKYSNKELEQIANQILPESVETKTEVEVKTTTPIAEVTKLKELETTVNKIEKLNSTDVVETVVSKKVENLEVKPPMVTVKEINLQACKGCHGQNFEKKALNKSKIVSEMLKGDLVTSLKGYKDGTYGGVMKSVMKSQVSKYSEQELEQIANQISEIK